MVAQDARTSEGGVTMAELKPTLSVRRREQIGERAFMWICRIAVILPLAVLVWLLGRVFVEGMGRLSLDFLTSGPSRHAAQAGIWPALMGSIWLIGLTIVIALPIGMGAAIYLEEYARRSRLAGIIEVAIANLAGVPSIIYGMLGLGLFVRAFGFGASVLSGACTLALLVLPVVIMASREALRTVLDNLREASLALGATRWYTIRHVVLPVAFPGILTGAILALSRAIGETAPLLLAGAVAFITFAPDGIDSPYTALPMQIYKWTSMPKADFKINAAAGICVLVATLLILNSAAILLRNRYQKRY
jgi:phosphate transport system permease protein